MSTKLIVDSKSILQFLKSAVKEQESFYGPVFSKMVAKYAVEYEARKVGDNTPPSVENIDQCVSYILDKNQKYADGISAIPYGIARTEKMLQGGIGPGARNAAKDAMKRLAEKIGTASLYGKVTSTIEAWKKHLDFAAMTHTKVEVLTVTGDENSALAKVEECHFSDACRAMMQENILTVTGKIECVIGKTDSSILEVITRATHDYELLAFNPPQCSFRMFKVQ
ncbi:MAG: hypothetical protein WED04_13085 [Promethearchaeati archaeon SRVP18_Atabeyarchaeia-1]